MAGGREFSASQRKIIDRYYQHKDSILAHRLGELVSDIAIAQGDEKKLNTLWKRTEKALAGTNIDPKDAKKVLESRDVAALSRIAAKLA
ncbi:MAG: hypothetical protein DHS20C14_13900 [Phycisphaeraceae bacterium]|nr:MAG: hypothetical protein DHS20C14_13900 [Phycisphaeraceae bacterium]